MTATVQELAAPVLSSPRQLDPDAGLMSKRRRGDLEAVEDTAALQLTSLRDYKTLYRLSLTDPEAFWGRVAEGFHWHKRWGPEFTRCGKTLAALVPRRVSKGLPSLGNGHFGL